MNRWSKSLVFACLCIFSLYLVGSGFAQDATSTPAPLFLIPTATSLPTATLAPSQILSALESYGLQPGDVPGFVASPDNGIMGLDKMILYLSNAYPDQAVVARSLGAVYQTYGVVGGAFANYFTPSCEGQTIFGIGTWIRGVVSQSSAEALAADPNVAGLYQGLFNWTPSTLTGFSGHVYQAPVAASLCSAPSTQYVDEYTVGRLLVAVSVYAPNTTDVSLVQGVLNNLVKLVSQRAQPVSIITTPTPTEANAAPTETAVAQASAGLIPFASPDDSTQLNPALTWDQGGSSANAYDLTLNPGTLTLIAGPGTGLACCNYHNPASIKYAIQGDFTASIEVQSQLSIDTDNNQVIFFGVVSAQDSTKYLLTDYAAGHNKSSIGLFNADTFNSGHDIEDVDYSGNKVYFKVQRHGPLCTFWYSDNGTSWTVLRANYVTEIPADAQITFGLYSYGDGIVAEFSDLTVKAQ